MNFRIRSDLLPEVTYICPNNTISFFLAELLKSNNNQLTLDYFVLL